MMGKRKIPDKLMKGLREKFNVSQKAAERAWLEDKKQKNLSDEALISFRKLSADAIRAKVNEVVAAMTEKELKQMKVDDKKQAQEWIGDRLVNRRDALVQAGIKLREKRLEKELAADLLIPGVAHGLPPSVDEDAEWRKDMIKDRLRRVARDLTNEQRNYLLEFNLNESLPQDINSTLLLYEKTLQKNQKRALENFSEVCKAQLPKVKFDSKMTLANLITNGVKINDLIRAICSSIQDGRIQKDILGVLDKYKNKKIFQTDRMLIDCRSIADKYKFNILDKTTEAFFKELTESANKNRENTVFDLTVFCLQHNIPWSIPSEPPELIPPPLPPEPLPPLPEMPSSSAGFFRSPRPPDAVDLSDVKNVGEVLLMIEAINTGESMNIDIESYKSCLESQFPVKKLIMKLRDEMMSKHSAFAKEFLDFLGKDDKQMEITLEIAFKSVRFIQVYCDKKCLHYSTDTMKVKQPGSGS